MMRYRLAAAAAALGLVAAGAPDTTTPGGSASTEMIALDVRVDGVPVLGSAEATVLELLSNATTQGDALAVVDALPAKVAGEELGRIGVRSDGPQAPGSAGVSKQVGPVSASVNPAELAASASGGDALALLRGATGTVDLLGGAVSIDIDDVGITSSVTPAGSESSQRLTVSGLRIDLGDLLDVEDLPLDVVLDLLADIEVPGDLESVVKKVTTLHEELGGVVTTVEKLVEEHGGLVDDVQELAEEQADLEQVLDAIDDVSGASVSGASFQKAQLGDIGGVVDDVTDTVDDTIDDVDDTVDDTVDDVNDTVDDTIDDVEDIGDSDGDGTALDDVLDTVDGTTGGNLSDILNALPEDELLELEQQVRDTLFGVTNDLQRTKNELITTTKELVDTVRKLVEGLPELVEAVTQLKLQLPDILSLLAATPILDTGAISLEMSAFAGPGRADTGLACEVSHLVVAGQAVEPPSCDSPEALKVLDATLEGLLGSLPLSAVPDVTLEFFNDASEDSKQTADYSWARSHVTAMEFALPSMSLGDLTDGLLADLAGVDLADVVADLEQQLGVDTGIDTSLLTGAVDDVDPILDQVQDQVADLLAGLPLPDALKGLRLPGIAVTIDPTSTATWVADPAAPVPPTVPGAPNDPNDPNGAPNPDDPNGSPTDPTANPGPGSDLPVTGGGAGLLGLALMGGAAELIRRRR